MSERFEVTRRAVGLGLLAAAFAAVAPRVAVAAATRAAPAAPEALFDFAIAGGWYHGLPRVWRTLEVGEELILRPEFDNEWDADALEVLRADGLKLGYVPRIANAPVAALIRQGGRVTARIVAKLDVKSEGEIPPDLVFTGFMNGDPRIRLEAVRPREAGP